MFDLTGKVAIVTGAAGGIAQGMAIGLAEAGADIVGVDIKEFDETQAEVEKLGRQFLGIQQNLMVIAEIPSIVEKTVAHFGHVDILINCAGMSDSGQTPDTLSWEEYEWIMCVNLTQMTKLSIEVYRQMRKQGTGGKIVNITSILALMAMEGSLAYSTSKNGIIGLTKAMATAGAQHGIWVNAIAPGSIRTKMLSIFNQDPADLYKEAPWIACKQYGTPDDLKGLAIFLSSKESDFIMGQVICADGGITNFDFKYGAYPEME